MFSEAVWLEFTEILVPVLAWARWCGRLRARRAARRHSIFAQRRRPLVLGVVRRWVDPRRVHRVPGARAPDLPFWPGVISIWDDFGARHIEWELVLLVSLGTSSSSTSRSTLCSPGMQGQKLVAVHRLLTLGIHSSIPRYGMFGTC